MTGEKKKVTVALSGSASEWRNQSGKTSTLTKKRVADELTVSV